MTKHELFASTNARVTFEVDYDGENLQHGQLTSINPKNAFEWRCTCGDKFTDKDDVLEHISSETDGVTVDTFQEVAENLYNDNTIREGVNGLGFVVLQKGIRGSMAYVGLNVGGTTHIIAEMAKGTETRGQGEARLKTWRGEFVRCNFREVTDVNNLFDNHPDGTSEVNIDRVQQIFAENEGESLETGYINGYRTTSLSNALEENFRYHEVPQ